VLCLLMWRVVPSGDLLNDIDMKFYSLFGEDILMTAFVNNAN